MEETGLSIGGGLPSEEKELWCKFGVSQTRDLNPKRKNMPQLGKERS